MQVEKVGWLGAKDFYKQLKCGIETEHFKALVTWPDGYDAPERIEVTMAKPFTFTSDEEHGIQAALEIRDALREELDDIKRMADNLIYSCGCYKEIRRKQDAVRVG